MTVFAFLPVGPFRGERIRFASRCEMWQIQLPCHSVRLAALPGSSHQPTIAAWDYCPCLTCRVSRVGEGWIELERPLIYDLRTEW